MYIYIYPFQFGYFEYPSQLSRVYFDSTPEISQKGQKVVRFSTSAVGRDMFWKKNRLANAKYGGKIESYLQISDN